MASRIRLPLAFGAGLSASLLVAACATGEDRTRTVAMSRDQCFNANFVSGFTPVDRDTVDIRVGPSRGYRLELNGFCSDINWADAVALRSRTGSFVCGPLDAELIVPSIAGPQRCIVTAMRPLTEAELRGPRRR